MSFHGEIQKEPSGNHRNLQPTHKKNIYIIAGIQFMNTTYGSVTYTIITE